MTSSWSHTLNWYVWLCIIHWIDEHVLWMKYRVLYLQSSHLPIMQFVSQVSHHKGPAMRKACPCYQVILILWTMYSSARGWVRVINYSTGKDISINQSNRESYIYYPKDSRKDKLYLRLSVVYMRASMSNHSEHFYVDMANYPWLTLKADLTNFCQ